MGKSLKKRRRKKARAGVHTRQNKYTMIGISLIVCMLFGVLLYQGNSIQERIDSNEEKMDQIAEQIEEQQQRTKEIDELEEYMQTDEYIEKAAQEKLGLLKENEIIFKAEE